MLCHAGLPFTTTIDINGSKYNSNERIRTIFGRRKARLGDGLESTSPPCSPQQPRSPACLINPLGRSRVRNRAALDFGDNHQQIRASIRGLTISALPLHEESLVALDSSQPYRVRMAPRSRLLGADTVRRPGGLRRSVNWDAWRRQCLCWGDFALRLCPAWT